MLGLQQSQPFLARAIPAAFFNDFSSLPATYFPEFFKFLFMVRLLHKLGDGDRRLTRPRPPLWSSLGEDENGNGIEFEITNAPLRLCSSSLAAPFSERALYPKAGY